MTFGGPRMTFGGPRMTFGRKVFALAGLILMPVGPGTGMTTDAKESVSAGDRRATLTARAVSAVPLAT